MVTDWQPIETAPKDGSYFLAFDAESAYQEIPSETMWLVRYVEKGWSRGRHWEIMLDGQFTKPTHWMPLPPPPTT